MLETMRKNVSLIAWLFSMKKEKVAKTTNRKIISDVVSTERRDGFVS